MRALVYSDLQATEGHERLHSDPTVPLQRARVRAFYKELLEIYNSHDCTCLWDLGDTTDDRNSLPVPTIDIVCDGLSRFPRNTWDLKLIGNHEQYLRSTEVHVGKMFAPYFEVVSGNMVYDTGQGTRVIACSYPANERDTVEWITSEKKKVEKQPGNRVILLGHFQVMGSMTGDGRLLAGVPKEAISWVNLGLLGHVHKPQSVSKRVHYVGSPFQQDWGETGEEKRVAIVDILQCSVEWVPLSGYPKYIDTTVDEFAELCTNESEDRFKVNLKSSEEASKFYAMPLAQRAEPVYDFNVTDRVSEDNTEECTGNESWSFNKVMERYVKRNTPESKGIPATTEEMIEFGHEFALA